MKGLFFSIIFTRVTAEGGERGERARGQEERIKRDCLKVKVSLEVRSSFEKTSTSTERKKKKKKSIHEVHHSTSTVSSLFFKKGTICLLCSMNHSIRVGVILSFIFLEISFFFQDNKRN